ncbi:DUF397 domain-containing protein [Streptomyces triculaminicus]|uniref:DUF397 domain-containing protein n=1 Tax=Streptomyces triculaminicus TaxID=2816232 RepID=UPI0037D02CB6
MRSTLDISRAVWAKSSYSGGDGGNCLEVAAWVKSSYSAGNEGQCLEFAPHHPTGVVPVRDSKDTGRTALAFGAPAWARFVASVKRAEIG